MLHELAMRALGELNSGLDPDIHVPASIGEALNAIDEMASFVKASDDLLRVAYILEHDKGAVRLAHELIAVVKGAMVKRLAVHGRTDALSEATHRAGKKLERFSGKSEAEPPAVPENAPPALRASDFNKRYRTKLVP